MVKQNNMKTNRICAIYTRVSTEEQNPQIQVDVLKKVVPNKISRFMTSIQML